MNRGRKPGTFADKLDIWFETASADELRDAAIAMNVWAQARKLGFKVRVEPLKPGKNGDAGQLNLREDASK